MNEEPIPVDEDGNPYFTTPKEGWGDGWRIDRIIPGSIEISGGIHDDGNGHLIDADGNTVGEVDYMRDCFSLLYKVSD
jgi:hypothetical protein